QLVEVAKHRRHHLGHGSALVVGVPLYYARRENPQLQFRQYWERVSRRWRVSLAALDALELGVEPEGVDLADDLDPVDQRALVEEADAGLAFVERRALPEELPPSQGEAELPAVLAE